MPRIAFYRPVDFNIYRTWLNGLIDLVEQAGAKVQGICIAIEKGFQDGGKSIRERGYRLESLAIIDKMTEDGQIFFRNQNN